MNANPSKSAGAVGALALAFSLAACGELSLAKVPIRAYAPAPSKTPSSSVAVNYKATTTSGNPDIFGATGWPCAGCSIITNPGYVCCGGYASQQTSLVNLGNTGMRWDYRQRYTVSQSITLAAYQQAMTAGCPPGSVCDPNTWNWNTSEQMGLQQAKAAGLKVFVILGSTTLWNSSNTSVPEPDQTYPLDLNVWDDINKKMMQHYGVPDYVEVWPEPETNGLSTSQYTQLYEHVVSTVRGLSRTIPIGGAGSYTSVGPSYLTAMHKDVNIATSAINFVSIHHYPQAWVGVESSVDQSMISTARSYWPNIPIWVTEWNYEGSCGTPESNDASDTVSGVGLMLVSFMNGGVSGSFHYSFQPGPPNNCSLFNTSSQNDANATLIDKAYVWFLMSKQLGLGAGISSIKSSSVNGVTAALAATNSAGKPVVVVVNHSSSSSPVAVHFQNLGLSGNVSLQTYLVDHGSNQAQSPIENTSVNVSSGSFDLHTITMTPYSVAGIILGATSAPRPTAP